MRPASVKITKPKLPDLQAIKDAVVEFQKQSNVKSIFDPKNHIGTLDTVEGIQYQFEQLIGDAGLIFWFTYTSLIPEHPESVITIHSELVERATGKCIDRQIPWPPPERGGSIPLPSKGMKLTVE
jgi:hypothetical protein